MVDFLELSPYVRAIFLTILFLLHCVNVCSLFFVFQRKNRVVQVSLLFCTMICMGILILYTTGVYCLNNQIAMNQLILWLMRKPIVLSILSLIFNGIFLFYILKKEWIYCKEVIQISVAQTTELHKLADTLIKKNHELEETQMQLQKYKENIEKYVCEKERLETKIQIHSKFGQSLLATRYAIQNEKEDLYEVLELWKKNIAMLQATSELKKITYSVEQLFKMAQLVDVHIKLKGEFPTNKIMNQLFCSISVEACINAVRHANAKNLYIEILETESAYSIQCTNDGIILKKEIVESGGLSSLRHKIESFHGTMSIQITEQFILNVTIPKKENPI